jgi:RimJ/RimL family protein N-acetyltransferase
VTVLRGDRVVLRPWQARDLDALAALNADCRVMRHFPQTLGREGSAAMMDRMQAHIAAHGWGNWALDVGGRCVGFVGLSAPRFEAHFTPCTEIGWRLAFGAWGHGYATESARLALGYGFGRLQLDAVVSYTSVGNLRSQRVMQRLGMSHDPADDFDHPRLPGHPLQRHVLYRLPRLRWQP